MKITVRPAETADGEQAIRVVRASIRQLCAADHHNDPATLLRWLDNKTTAHFTAWIESPDNFCVVGDAGSAIVGVGLLHKSGEIRLFYVAPGFERNGLGTAIHAVLEERARQLNLQSLRLCSTDAARQFYAGRGYLATGPRQQLYGQLWCFPCARQL